MRIISGIARGIRLKAPEGYYVRPTNDLVKEAMFSIIGDLEGKVILDVFSGSGALGLEALSRGAKQVIFVEKEKQGIKTIRQNLLQVQKNLEEDCEKTGRVQIYQEEALKAIQKLIFKQEKIDLIFADPPYQTEENEFGAVEMLQNQEFAILSKGAILVLEHAAKTALPWNPHTVWKLLKQRKFGIRCLSFARNIGE